MPFLPSTSVRVVVGLPRLSPASEGEERREAEEREARERRFVGVEGGSERDEEEEKGRRGIETGSSLFAPVALPSSRPSQDLRRERGWNARGDWGEAVGRVTTWTISSEWIE